MVQSLPISPWWIRVFPNLAIVSLGRQQPSLFFQQLYQESSQQYSLQEESNLLWPTAASSWSVIFIINLGLVCGILNFTLLQFFFIHVNENIFALIAIGLCLGVFLIPYTALFTSYASEAVFPLPEGSATGYIFAASQTFGFVAGLGSISLIESSEKG